MSDPASPRTAESLPVTAEVLAHVLTERNMQREKYGDVDDLGPEAWDDLIRWRLAKPGLSRYVRLVQIAALAVAAAENHKRNESSDEA